jgi:hypothetical protein
MYPEIWLERAVLIDAYSRVQFTSPQRGEVGLRSKPGEGTLH